MPEETLLENPFVVIGDEDIVTGLRALGFKTYALKDSADFKSVLDEIARSNTAVCLVQDDIYESHKGEIDIYKNIPLPAFIPLALKNLHKDLLTDIVKDIHIKATGAF